MFLSEERTSIHIEVKMNKKKYSHVGILCRKSQKLANYYTENFNWIAAKHFSEMKHAENVFNKLMRKHERERENRQVNECESSKNTV